VGFLDGTQPRAFAHRGWHVGDLAGCENTLASFRRAVDEGYRYLETDVHLTADGVLVAFHDAALDRVTDGRGPIARLTFREVRRARVAGRFTVPTLSEVLEACPAAQFNIDPKSDRSVEPLLALLDEHDAWSRVCIGSFSDRRLARIRAGGPVTLATSLGPRAAARLVSGVRTSRSGSWLGAVAAQLPTRFRGIPVVTGRLLRAAHGAGLEVHVWTVNEATRMSQLLDLGVDGIMTDRPDTLRAVLQERGQW
jgi:glycerophosphoryl diester phosphodiesterase